MQLTTSFMTTMESPPKAKDEELQTIGIGCKLVVDLLDEYWFSDNILISRKSLGSPPSTDSSNTEEVKEIGSRCPNEEREMLKDCAIGTTAEALFRMPTLPPRLQVQASVQEKGVRLLKSCNPKLRHSLSSLDNYQSTSVKGTLYSSSKVRDRPPRYIKLERADRYVAIQHYIAKEAYYRKIFKEKKWRSLSDLEYIEVQGFKDLGFVFDNSGVNSTMKKIIPGLSEKKAMNGEKIARPYLSEAWIMQRTSPPMFGCSDKRSVEDMKAKLKFWARAVASNAREDF